MDILERDWIFELFTLGEPFYISEIRDAGWDIIKDHKREYINRDGASYVLSKEQYFIVIQTTGHDLNGEELGWIMEIGRNASA